MDAREIFELIVRADERLKYATEGNAALRRAQARELLERARRAALEIGDPALARQAELRLADLGAEHRPGRDGP